MKKNKTSGSRKATPTIAGVIAGRDEVLEKALGYVRTGSR